MLLGLQTVSSLERCPLFGVPFIERFHCLHVLNSWCLRDHFSIEQRLALGPGPVEERNGRTEVRGACSRQACCCQLVYRLSLIESAMYNNYYYNQDQFASYQQRSNEPLLSTCHSFWCSPSDEQHHSHILHHQSVPSFTHVFGVVELLPKLTVLVQVQPSWHIVSKLVTKNDKEWQKVTKSDRCQIIRFISHACQLSVT